jgi:hypothetical protein
MRISTLDKKGNRKEYDVRIREVKEDIKQPHYLNINSSELRKTADCKE